MHVLTVEGLMESMTQNVISKNKIKEFFHFEIKNYRNLIKYLVTEYRYKTKNFLVIIKSALHLATLLNSIHQDNFSIYR